MKSKLTTCVFFVRKMAACDTFKIQRLTKEQEEDKTNFNYYTQFDDEEEIHFFGKNYLLMD